ncbi:hypothetical protein QTP70_035143, partial [Hemibagrus guttatus]
LKSYNQIADDNVVVTLIINNDESAYRKEVEQLAEWSNVPSTKQPTQPAAMSNMYQSSFGDKTGFQKTKPLKTWWSSMG